MNAGRVAADRTYHPLSPGQQRFWQHVCFRRCIHRRTLTSIHVEVELAKLPGSTGLADVDYTDPGGQAFAALAREVGCEDPQVVAMEVDADLRWFVKTFGAPHLKKKHSGGGRQK